MRRLKFLKKQPEFRLTAALFLSVLLSVSLTMCISDGFGLQCRFMAILAWCTLCAAAVIYGAKLRYRRLAGAAALAALGLLAAWQRQTVYDSALTTVFRITSRYAEDFSSMKILGADEGYPLWIMLAPSMILSSVTAWVQLGTRRIWAAAAVCAPMLAICLLCVEIAPPGWLAIFTGSFVLLVLTQGARSHNPEAADLLIRKLLLPVVIFMAVLLLIAPAKDYTRFNWSTILMLRAEDALGIERPGNDIVIAASWNRSLGSVNLGSLGERELTGKPALRYKADTSVGYLRGVSLGHYENNRWSAVDPMIYAQARLGRPPLLTGGDDHFTLQVKTYAREPQLYTAYNLPSIPEGVVAIDDAYLENTLKTQEYSLRYTNSILLPEAEYANYVYANYTQLPDDLRSKLESYLVLNQLLGSTPQGISAHVSKNCVYDLNAQAVPRGEDFALYFLKESQRGYCVHFATATVLLLRAIGVPARYVTGYAAVGGPGEWNEVTEDMAHAWVEYYRAGKGWQVLDPTPAGWLEAHENAGTEEPAAPDEEQQTAPEENVPQEEPETTAPPSTTAADPSKSESEKTELPSKSLFSGFLGSDNDGEGADMELPVEFAVVGRMIAWLLLPAAVLAAAVLRRRILLRRRRHACTEMSPNACLLGWWGYLVQLTEKTGRWLDPALEELAERAKFSLHTVSGEDIARVRRAAQEELRILRTHTRGKRFWYRWGLVLY